MSTSTPDAILTRSTDKPVGPLQRLIRSLFRRDMWALTDQGVVSAADFLAAALIARWLGKNELGIYGVVLETILWINALQGAVILYPLTVRGAGGDRKALRGPATAALLFTLLLAPLLCSAMGIAGALSSKRIGVAIAAALGMILWQLQETVRQALKAHLRFAACLPGDCIRHFGQVVGIWMLHRANLLNVTNVFVVIGVVSALATVVQALQVGLVRVGRADIVRLARDFWMLGKWMLPANVLAAVTSVGFLWVLQYFHGNGQAGTNSAVVIPLKLTVPVSIGLASVITPSVARAMKEFGARAATPVARQSILLGIALLTPYYLLVLVAPRFVLHVFLGSRYVDYLDAIPLVRLYVINFAVTFIQVSSNAWLGGLGLSRYLFYTQIIKTGVGLLISLPATAIWGVQGLILGNILALTVEAASNGYFIRLANLGRIKPVTESEPIPPPRGVEVIRSAK